MGNTDSQEIISKILGSDWDLELLLALMRLTLFFILVVFISVRNVEAESYSGLVSTISEQENLVKPTEDGASLNSNALSDSVRPVQLFSEHTPVSIQSQHPLELIHLRPQMTTAGTTKEGDSLFSVSPVWSNTLNRRKGYYLIDCETVALDTGFSYGLSNKLSISGNIPLAYRSGGVTDPWIEDFHSVFGLPQGQRKKVEENNYRIEGITEEDDFFSWKEDGFGLGSSELRADYSFYRKVDSVASAFISGGVPGIGDSFSQDSVDIALGAIYSKQASFLTITVGGMYEFYGDTFESGIEYRTHHEMAYLASEFPIQESVSTIVTASYQSALIDNISHYPIYSVYLDLALRIHDVGGRSLNIGFRENPGPDSGTIDFAIFSQLNLPLR